MSTSKPTLIVLCGLPGSGKSTYAMSLGRYVVSADAVRGGAVAARVFAEFHRDIDSALGAGLDVVADSCALIESERRELRRIAERRGARRELHLLVGADVATCRARDARRARPARVDWEAYAARWQYTVRVVGREGWHAVRRVGDAAHEHLLRNRS